MNSQLNSQLKTRLMVMAGGTGGHVYPALAVANALRERNTHITWLGTKCGLEATVIPANNIDIEWVSVEGLRGKGAISWLLAPFNLLRAMWQSASAIRKTKPDCVLGMGGFVSGPGGLVARLMGKPLVVHEQNAVAGLTNKYLAKVANRVLSGFPNVEDLPVQTLWIGNPVRADIAATGKSTSEGNNEINVLVIGGSQGAHSLNLHLPRLFAAQSVAINIWHQTGRGRSVDVVASYKALGLNAKSAEFKVTEFIDDMAGAYQWADLLVCRAGAMTIAECCAAEKPSLLIPYPHSAGDHQVKNAQTLVNIGAAVMMSNEAFCASENLPELTKLLADKSALYTMGQKAHSLYKPDAVKQMVRVCEEYLNA